VGRDPVRGGEAARDRHRESGVEEGRDRAPVHRTERAHERVRHVHPHDGFVLVGALDAEPEERHERRQAHSDSCTLNRPAYTASPSQRWRTIWQTETPAWIASGRPATFDISSTCRLLTPGATNPT
jgi:hypothetical protein